MDKNDKRVIIKYMKGIIDTEYQGSRNQRLATAAQWAIINDDYNETLKNIERIEITNNRQNHKKNFSLQILKKILRGNPQDKKYFSN